MSRTSTRVIVINLLVMLLYAIGLRIYAVQAGHEAQMMFVFTLAFALVVHAIGVGVVGLVLVLMQRRDAGVGLLLSMLLVPLIGVGVCFGGAAIPTERPGS